MLSDVDNQFHVAQVGHLLLTIRNALRWHDISNIAMLPMHVVAWHKNEFKALVALIILNSPDLHLVAELVPIDAVEVAIRICLVSLQECGWVWAWWGKIIEVHSWALVNVDMTLVIDTLDLPYEADDGFDESRIVFELLVEEAFDSERET